MLETYGTAVRREPAGTSDGAETAATAAGTTSTGTIATVADVTEALDHAAGALVAWGNALLAGAASPDETAEMVRRAGGDPDVSHLVAGLPGETGPVGLTMALGRLRRLGVVGLRLVLPVAGDALGLPGPAEFNAAAVEAGQAVLTVGGQPYGLLPETADATVCWRLHEVNPVWAAPHVSLSDAETELLVAVGEATERLVRLDVARLDPDLADALLQLRRGRPEEIPLPRCCPPRAHRLLALAEQVAAITGLAHRTPGAAVSAGQLAARTAALYPLERIARRARQAAYNALSR